MEYTKYSLLPRRKKTYASQNGMKQFDMSSVCGDVHVRHVLRCWNRNVITYMLKLMSINEKAAYQHVGGPVWGRCELHPLM